MKRLEQETVLDLLDATFIPDYNAIVAIKKQIFSLEVLCEYLKTTVAVSKEEKYKNTVLADKLEIVINKLKGISKDLKEVTDDTLKSVAPEDMLSRVYEIIK